MEIEFNKILVVAGWKWTVKHEDCGICRNPFDDCCADCKAPGDDCPLVSGKCTHCFHIHCIEKWLNQPHMLATQLCPMCRQEWNIAS